MPLNATFSAASKRGFTSFEQDFWIPTQTLTANSPSAGDGFGYSIAMDDNSLYLAVTAPNEITSSNKGSVYVFYRGSRWKNNWQCFRVAKIINNNSITKQLNCQ
jgi:hypothetical protein